MISYRTGELGVLGVGPDERVARLDGPPPPTAHAPGTFATSVLADGAGELTDAAGVRGVRFVAQ